MTADQRATLREIMNDPAVRPEVRKHVANAIVRSYATPYVPRR